MSPKGKHGSDTMNIGWVNGGMYYSMKPDKAQKAGMGNVAYGNVTTPSRNQG